VLLAATPAYAQTAVAPEKVKPEDVVTSPLEDMNLRKRDIPPVLEHAAEKPYDLTGIKTCRGYQTAIADLDAVLGADIDVAEELSDDDKTTNTAASVAKTLLGGLIPFRSVVRELSGANARERAWERAIYAGSVRRAFLKGVGQQRGCGYPARAATPEVLAKLTADRGAAELARKQSKEQAANLDSTAATETATDTQPAPAH
jgi:hypothetical protein